MVVKDHVPNLFPATDPGEARLAFVGEAPALAEVSWSTCQQGHEFARLYRERGRELEHTSCPVLTVEGVPCGAAFNPTPKPFVGPAGRLLDHVLTEVGIERSRCFVGNVSQWRAPGDKIERWDWDDWHIREGLLTLRADLVEFQPTLVVLLGGVPLRAFCGEKRSVTDWRGSLFLSDFVTGFGLGTVLVGGIKCLSTLHPAAILHVGQAKGDEDRKGGKPEWLAYLRFDLARAAEEMRTPTLTPLVRKYVLNPAFDQVLEFCVDVHRRRLTVGHDVEGVPETGITVMSFATTPQDAFSIPLRRCDWTKPWGDEQEARVIEAVKGVLEDPHVTKVLTNAAYEKFIWRWCHRVEVVNVHDTMFSWWEVWSELEKGLDTQASILTKRPFWKFARESKVDQERDTYNCEDACATLECHLRLREMLGGLSRLPTTPASPPALTTADSDQRERVGFHPNAPVAVTPQSSSLGEAGDVQPRPTTESNGTEPDHVAKLNRQGQGGEWPPTSLSHYELNLALLDPLLDMETKGVRYDVDGAHAMLDALNAEINALQGELDDLAGIGPPTFAEVARIVCFARKLDRLVDWPDIVAAAKPSWKKVAPRIVELAARSTTAAPLGTEVDLEIPF